MNRILMAALLLMSFNLPGTAAPAIKPFSTASIDQIVSAHKGKPFVLFVWSMDCEFCQASLDHLAKARAADPGLVIVTVTTDPIGDTVLGAQVNKRLTALALQDNAWSFADQAPEQLRYAIDPRWRGEKPRSYWYDKDGNRVAYSGVISPAKLLQLRR